MAYFKGYTYKHREEAILNSMHFELTCYFDPNAPHPREADCPGCGNWRYFYRGEEIPFSDDLYTTENNLHVHAPASDPTLDEDYEAPTCTEAGTNYQPVPANKRVRQT